MKTDARVRYTKKIIRETFLDILKEKPVSKITVKEICDKAEINRGTFYKHYRDCYDLMEKIEEDALRQFVENIETTDIHTLLLSILEAVQSHAQLIRTMSDTAGSQGFIRRLKEYCFHHMDEWLEYSSDGSLSETARIAGSVFLAGGCSGVIEYWLLSGMNTPPEEIASLIDTLSKSVAKRLAEL